MNGNLILATATLALGTGATAFAQESRPAFLYPDTGAPVAAEIPADSPVLQAAEPVGDSGAWLSVDYKATFEGYVDPAALNEDDSIAAAALIYEAPRPGATVLAESDPAATITVLERDPLWAYIRTTQPVTLFVRDPSVPLETAAAATARPAPGPDSAAGPGEPDNLPAVDDEDAQTVATTEYEEGAAGAAGGEPADEGEAVLMPVDGPESARAEPTGPEPEAAAPAAEAEAAPETSSVNITRHFYGTLRKRTNFPWRRHDDIDFALENRQGKTVALVDTSDLLLFGSIETYLDRPVVIQGVTEPLKGRPSVIIRARTMQVN